MKNNVIKRIVCGIVASATCLMMLSACNNSTTASSSTTDSSVSSTESKNETSTDNNNNNNGEAAPIRDIKSIDLIKEMTVGWNLGNTLDAGHEGVRGSEPETIEQSWGNPVTTKAMVDALKEKGFNVIRVPVTWDWSTGEAPDYKISDAWMNRVQEVVDYGIENGMFVILDIHHETWHDPYEENYEKASDRLKKVWTQIGNRFANYDEHLIFEGMNEPRLRNTANEWNGGTKEAREVVAKLCLDFVNTVRALGGNNAKRHLMIQGYAAANEDKVLKSIVLPENDDKIIVSVHAYIPYNFALKENGTSKWVAYKSGCTNDIDSLCSRVKSMFIDKGVAVIVGEFGAVNRDNTQDREDYSKYFITKMKTIDVPCVWWDNGAVSGNGELFGILDRRTLKWTFDGIATALTSAAKGEYNLEELKKAPEEDNAA